MAVSVVVVATGAAVLSVIFLVEEGEHTATS